MWPTSARADDARCSGYSFEATHVQIPFGITHGTPAALGFSSPFWAPSARGKPASARSMREFRYRLNRGPDLAQHEHPTPSRGRLRWDDKTYQGPSTFPALGLSDVGHASSPHMYPACALPSCRVDAAVDSRRVDAAATPARAFNIERRQWPGIGRRLTIQRSENRRSFKSWRSTRCQEPTLKSPRQAGGGGRRRG